jgi:uncharacterized membrane protein
MKSRQPKEVFMSMSFREKSAWISILSISGIYGFYFWSIIYSGRRGDLHAGGLLATIIAIAVVQAVLTVAVALFTPKEASAPQDERERLIELRAARFAYAALATSVACACYFGGFDPPVIFNTNTLLFILVMAELLRSGCQIVQYRRGA